MATDDVPGLFALPPQEFTAARNALSRRLREGGDRDRAEEVRSLRRPTVAAWALNQLVRRDPDAVDELLRAGEDLVRAQRRALSGLSDSGLGDAARRRRGTIGRLTEAAAGILTEAGVDAAAHHEAIAHTLEAASVDDQAAEALMGGQLSRPLPPPSGFGGISGFEAVPARRAGRDVDEPVGEGRDVEARDVEDRDVEARDVEDREVEERAEAVAAAQRELAARRDRAAQAAASRRAAAKAEKDTGRQARRAEELAERLEGEAQTARREAEAAAGRLERARAELVEAEELERRRARDVEEARARLDALE